MGLPRSFGPRLNDGFLTPQFDAPSTGPLGESLRGGDVIPRAGAPIEATPWVAHPDNVEDFFETGRTWINSIAVSNHGESGFFRLSYTNLDNTGTIPNTDLRRHTVNLRAGYYVNDKLEVSTAVNYINASSDNRPGNGYGSENAMYTFLFMGRQVNVRSMREYWQRGYEHTQQFSFNYRWFDNPYFTFFENTNAFDRDRLIGNIMVRYQFTDNLSLLVRTGLDYSNELRQFTRAFSSQRFPNGSYSENDVEFTERNSDFLLTYHNEWQPWSLKVSFGGNHLRQETGLRISMLPMLSIPGIYSFNNSAVPLEVYEFDTEKEINSLYGMARLGFRDWIYLDVTARNDWSSALASPAMSGKVSYFYPSASISINASEILEVPAFISYWKLRGSWAQVGNDTDPYRTSNVFATGEPYDAQPTATDQNQVANQDLRPEEITSFEVGTELTLFRNRLMLDLTYYNSLSKDQILTLPAASSSGYASRLVNGGSVRSRGIEALLEMVPVQHENFQWRTGFNFSRDRTWVEALPPEVERFTLGFSRVYETSSRTVFVQAIEGERMGNMYGTGLQRTPDGQVIHNADGLPQQDNELRLLGNYNPDFMLGVFNNFSFKGLNLGILLDWRQGGKFVSKTQLVGGTTGTLQETAFRPEGGIVGQGVVNTGTVEDPVYVQNTTPVNPQQILWRHI